MYPVIADNVPRFPPSRLRGVHQPVTSPRIGFSGPFAARFDWISNTPNPVPIVREQGRCILAKAVGQNERRTVGCQYLRDVVADPLGDGQGAFPDVESRQ